MNATNKCKCFHHVIVPGLIFLIGLVLLLGNLEVLSASLTAMLWPIGLALVGLMKMFSNKCVCCCSCGCSNCCNKDQPCTPSC